ncbi:cupin domain-containing protein [Chloroflexota bacterium]
MEVYRIDEFINKEVPVPGERFRLDILTETQKADHLFGLFLALEPGGEIPYHYHRTRESLMIILSGEATETVEGKEVQIKAGQVIYVPAGEKHGMKNNTDTEFRFLEYYTGDPGVEDRVVVE